MLFYFGCWNESGHYLHVPGGRNVVRAGPFTPADLDCGFAPDTKGTWAMRDHQDESAPVLHHHRGWTVLAMWDRSVDSRPGSNAAFLTEGTHTEGQMWALAEQFYPQIVQRLKAYHECRARSDVERARLIERARKLRINIEQIFTDCASWNENVRKPHEEPIDPDPDGQLRRMADGLDRMLVAEARR